MTKVSYIYTNNDNKEISTTSYKEVEANKAKGTFVKTIYTPIYDEYEVDSERKRVKL